MTVHIHRDSWGIPTLSADSARELAYAQGRLAAQDRAWQLEMEHRRLRGTCAAVLGPPALDWDVLVRRAQLAQTARRCLLALDDATRDWVTAYTDGVNSALPEAARSAPEFAATGAVPGRWQPWVPLGVWLATHLFFAGLPAKLWRAEVTQRLGPEAVAWFTAGTPGTAGSNGWLLTGERTATGAALLAGDPHRYAEDPGCYQQIRLVCPEFDVLGFAVPGVPGLPHFGHAGTVAWAITHAMADYQDLYRERLRRTDDGVEALGPDGWEPAGHGVETVTVAGAAPVTIDVWETERGPVLFGGPEDAEAFSLRHVPRVTARLGFAALPRLLRARTVADVDAACEDWVEPVNVLLAADAEGGTLHRVAGRVPVRDPENRLRPVPAWDARYAWRPDAYEPTPRAEVTDGLAVMANERGLAAPLGVEFLPGHQHRRITELLRPRRDWTADEMARVHGDTRSGGAPAVLDQLADRAGPAGPAGPAGLEGLSPAARALAGRLLAWDRRMDADSHDAAAYAALRAACARRLATHPAFAPLATLSTEPLGAHPDAPASPAGRPGPRCPAPLRPWLELRPRIAFALETLLTPGVVPGLDPAALVREALEEVANEGAEQGTWGERHRLALWRPLPSTGGPALDVPLAGDHDCVWAAGSVPGVTDTSTRCPVARHVWDLGDRARSRWVVPLGAQGTADHPHHHDQTPHWAAGRLLPVETDPARLTHEASLAVGQHTAAPRTPAYARDVPGFGTVSLVPVDPVADLALLHGWVTEERAAFWGMVGAEPIEVLEIYEYLDALPTHHSYLVHRDGVPVGLFQTYDPAADEVGAHYPVAPGDLGVHLLLAPPRGPLRRGFTGGLIPCLVEFVFADPRVRRIVAEPDLGNGPAVERALRTGLVLGPVIELPDKRARLAFLTREATRKPDAAARERGPAARG
ncbi:GNAT family N-acetyltransferase [Streptomyces sp. 3MP-14]|uniref:Lysine N-acyltransferase MbtK n=1 Tax=Streptomyces mimosae TaxID=2586635 RepID=A0A5N6AC15_9ACTN|nr:MULTISPECIES: GNAT family N-acetyltransferase [Streptomyces]KAB8165795.1 GNAT family N-acetyltransferase [Streptomyces mimosae]KAB8176184.1 GNAT family N-acetyltransferase [Streptomyces sp. 3MP-14]